MMQKKYFGTDGIRGRIGDSLINPEFVLKLGWAAGRVLGHGHEGKVLIGKDTRISGYMLESALEAGLSAAGMDIHLVGPMPTPAIAYLTRTLRAKAGIMISASHNAYQDNGIKFFCEQGFKLADEVELAIEEQLGKTITTVESAQLGKAMRINDAPGRYIEFCKSTVPHKMSLEGLKIIVDCAQGATYHVAPNVFQELGAKIIKIGVHPDGLNINAHCGSTKPGLLQKTVIEEQADLGIAFDGDGDRVLMVDHRGELVEGDELLFIMVQHRLQRDRSVKGVVGTVMSNLGLEQALHHLNIPFHRTPVGDRYVLEELLKTGWILGGENSGHIVNLFYTTTGDGIISALQVLRAMNDQGKSLHELKKGMYKYPQVLINVPIDKPISLQQPNIAHAVAMAEKKLNDKGRILLRASGTEAVIRVMIEGEDADTVNSLATELATVVKQQSD